MAEIKGFEKELKKIVDNFYISKGYTSVNGVYKTPSGKKARSVSTIHGYNKNFKKFWDKSFIKGDTAIYHDTSKVYNPKTKRFVNKKGFITQKGNVRKKKEDKGIEIHQNKVIKPEDYLVNVIQPQVQNAMESGNKTEITIKSGEFGKIEKLLDLLPFGEKKMYFVMDDGSYYFLNTDNVKRIADIEKKIRTGVEVIESVI